MSLPCLNELKVKYSLQNRVSILTTTSRDIHPVRGSPGHITSRIYKAVPSFGDLPRTPAN